MEEARDETLPERGPPARRRVLHVVPNLDLGGAPLGALEIATELNRRGKFEATVCVLGEPPRERGVDVGTLRVMYLRRPTSRRRAFLGRLLALDAVIREVDPHLVHAHLWPAAEAAALVARFRRFPLIVHIRDTPERFSLSDPRSSIRRRWYQRLFAHPGMTFVAVSQAAADYAALNLEIPEERIRVVLNGIDGEPFARVAIARVGLPALGVRRIIVGAVGRFVLEKGHMFLLEAVNRLVRRGLDIGLVLVGSGRLLGDYKRFVTTHGLEERIEIRGPTGNMAEFYESIDLFVLPSVSSEGLSRALLEAMACNLPIVSTDCPGSEEVIRDGENGLIVGRRSVETLEAAIHRLCRSPRLCAELSHRARERYSKHHTIDAVVGEIERLYSCTLPRPTQGPGRQELR